MIYDYILKNYGKGDPIFLNELPGKSRDYLRQEMKKLVDEGKLKRLYQGVYYLPYTTILGTEGKISTGKYIEKKYLEENGKAIGYITGLGIANDYGFTTQNPACYEVCSNKATTKQRKDRINGLTIYVYQPKTIVTDENKTALQFLDLMSVIDRYSEISGKELEDNLKDYVKQVNLDFSQVRKYLPLYPDCVFRNIYEGGLIRELV